MMWFSIKDITLRVKHTFLHQFRKAVPKIKQALSIIEEHNLVSKLPKWPILNITCLSASL